MNCCTFGSLRMDITIPFNIEKYDIQSEIRITELKKTIGGSVFNTSMFLAMCGCKTTFYTSNQADSLPYVQKLSEQYKDLSINFNEGKYSSAPISIIFLDDSGEKKMISYDGKRNDLSILIDIKKRIGSFSFFYTSFYEITLENSNRFIDVLKTAYDSSVIAFLDLCPLLLPDLFEIYNVILRYVMILSGTKDEYLLLLQILGITTISELQRIYDIKYIFVKKGGQGADLYYNDKVISYTPCIKKDSFNTTGCGDVFNASVIYALSRNLSNESILSQSVENASSIAYNGLPWKE